MYGKARNNPNYPLSEYGYQPSKEDDSTSEPPKTGSSIQKDNINPNHYKQGKIECIEALESATTNKRGIEAICTANAIKYLWRYESKNGLEDVKKAKWYINRLIKVLGEKEPVNNAESIRKRISELHEQRFQINEEIDKLTVEYDNLIALEDMEVKKM